MIQALEEGRYFLNGVFTSGNWDKLFKHIDRHIDTFEHIDKWETEREKERKRERN